MKIPKVEDSEIIFDQFVKIRRDTLCYDERHERPYFTLMTKGDAVNVLAVTPTREFVLIEEYRHPTGKVLLGCPGGYIDEGETPLDAAKRELFEETGYVASSYQEIGSAYPYPGLSSQKITFVLASGAMAKASQQLEMSELIRTVLMSEGELDEAVKHGVQLDGIFCSALFFFRSL